MNQNRAPLIAEGQFYLNQDMNEYLIVIQNKRGQVKYGGSNFRGMMNDESFIETYLPVDPADVDSNELKSLLSLCSEGTTAKTGFIQED